MNRNGQVLRSQVSGRRSHNSKRLVTGSGFLPALMLLMLIGAAAAVYLAPGPLKTHAAQPGSQKAVSTLSLPLFFEPNQGQTDPQVKFLARGAGFGLFLTSDEAVLKLQSSAARRQQSADHVIRMRLEGASKSPSVSGAAPLPGKSNYFIGNDPSKWRRGIPQFARVEYQAVYPGVDLVYYGHQGQLEYDFHIAPAANPNQIALHFDGASARIDAGDLIFTTGSGEVRFHAPNIYQTDGNSRRAIAGGFRQIAPNTIGFTVGTYDSSRELVIDPILSYSTYLGGDGSEISPRIAVDAGFNMYVAGSTTSTAASFPVTNGSALTGAQNIFVARIRADGSALDFAVYLGGTATDTATGVAVDAAANVYVAGFTTSTDFPTTANAFQTTAGAGTHGFLSKLDSTGAPVYSTLLAGTNATNNPDDEVTGLAIDATGDAFVTGTTTSTNSATGFPSTTTAFQPCPFQQGVTCATTSGPKQFFASKINTLGSGNQSMLYSTYFGGPNPTNATSTGGGIAVDPSGNMYFTGGTNMLPPSQGNPGFPLFNAQQSCLDQPGINGVACAGAPTATDAFVAKINPNLVGSAPVYSTYLGGSSDDVGLAIAVDAAGAAYITGSTTSDDWAAPTAITPFQPCLNNAAAATPCPPSTASDAFIAKIGPPVTTSGITNFPLTYFTYLGGSGSDSGQAIAVDTIQGAHVAGSTDSPDLEETSEVLPGHGTGNDAFVALISTTALGRDPSSGDYLTYLGGDSFDQATGIALAPNDLSDTTFVTGETRSLNFPTKNPFRSTLNGPQDAFVSKISPHSVVVPSVPTDSTGKPTSPSPNPANAGNNVAFTFDLTNQGPDIATNVIFTATVPTTGVTSQSAKVTSGNGTCAALAGNTITCTITSLTVNSTAGSSVGIGVVEVDLTPSVSTSPGGTPPPPVTVVGVVNVNGFTSNPVSETVTVDDFKISATLSPTTVTAGESTVATITLTPNPTYSATISMTESGLPAASTATFSSSSVVLSGTAQASTTLNIATTARPVATGSLMRRHVFYAAWLPVGGLSLLGLGIGAGCKRRRRWTGALLGLVAAIILLQVACGSSSTPTATGGTPAGSYTITITGASGTVQHNTTVQLIVN